MASLRWQAHQGNHFSPLALSVPDRLKPLDRLHPHPPFTVKPDFTVVATEPSATWVENGPPIGPLLQDDDGSRALCGHQSCLLGMGVACFDFEEMFSRMEILKTVSMFSRTLGLLDELSPSEMRLSSSFSRPPLNFDVMLESINAPVNSGQDATGLGPGATLLPRSPTRKVQCYAHRRTVLRVPSNRLC
eukprot:GHVN01058122.1.p1 GENE.GHVN01058122.1~~GHVN01058122.1.p1  ORF type:complete len:189 (+),score=11.83 GHVN01058122.1:1058-1624(+)